MFGREGPDEVLVVDALVAELADAPALGAGAVRRVGSTPTECIYDDIQM